jgi:ketosteroid isomerase-like protein
MTESTARSQITISSPEDAIKEWFALLGRYCAAIDYAGGESIFAPETIAFGTKARIVEGLEHVRTNQWEAIWPNIRDFKIGMEQVRGFGDERWAWGVATWTSTGFDRDGQPYFRPGRATVVLERRDGRWLAKHSHFSLAPGTPQETFGTSGSST